MINISCFIFGRFDIKANGFISSLPFVAQSIICIISGWFTDILISKVYFKTLTIRKINTALGLLVPAVTVVLAGMYPDMYKYRIFCEMATII